MKTVFAFAFLLLAQMGPVNAFADGGEGNNSLPLNDAPESARMVNWRNDVGPPPVCRQGFEPVYDVGFGRWVCVPATGGGGNGGDGGGGN